ncbi:hypothetical protein GCM10011366_09440 [Ornithinimicrobium tianjinense]|uniref:Uncharacterized protein n=1 Tax=Ornithinimicrobium tianjinense TaxID=1195761 RepID=A0A917BGH8_9MICO|nr:hypothetical protein GCM10011366_09440 [Ornithinimicrobium tianjinense]
MVQRLPDGAGVGAAGGQQDGAEGVVEHRAGGTGRGQGVRREHDDPARGALEVAEALHLAGTDPQPRAVGDCILVEVHHVPDHPLVHGEQEVEVGALGPG